jgi:Transposase
MVRAWLSDHPEIRVVSRDRGGGYGEAAAKALPGAVQVADRWHLMENASAAFVNAVRRSMRAIRTAIGATTINPELLTRAERLQYEGYLRRKQTNAAIMALVREAVPLKEIVRRTGRSRKLARQVSRGESTVESALEKLAGCVGADRAYFVMAGDAMKRQLHWRAQRWVRSFSMAPITLPAAVGAPGLPCGRCRVRPCARAVMDPARSSGSMGSGTD